MPVEEAEGHKPQHHQISTPGGSLLGSPNSEFSDFCPQAIIDGQYHIIPTELHDEKYSFNVQKEEMIIIAPSSSEWMVTDVDNLLEIAPYNADDTIECNILRPTLEIPIDSAILSDTHFILETNPVRHSEIREMPINDKLTTIESHNYKTPILYVDSVPVKDELKEQNGTCISIAPRRNPNTEDSDIQSHFLNDTGNVNQTTPLINHRLNGKRKLGTISNLSGYHLIPAVSHGTSSVDTCSTAEPFSLQSMKDCSENVADCALSPRKQIPVSTDKEFDPLIDSISLLPLGTDQLPDVYNGKYVRESIQSNGCHIPLSISEYLSKNESDWSVILETDLDGRSSICFSHITTGEKCHWSSPPDSISSFMGYWEKVEIPSIYYGKYIHSNELFDGSFRNNDTEDTEIVNGEHEDNEIITFWVNPVRRIILLLEIDALPVTPIILSVQDACLRGNVAYILDFFFAGGDVTSLDLDGIRPIHYVVAGGNKYAFRLLLEFLGPHFRMERLFSPMMSGYSIENSVYGMDYQVECDKSVNPLINILYPRNTSIETSSIDLCVTFDTNDSNVLHYIAKYGRQSMAVILLEFLEDLLNPLFQHQSSIPNNYSSGFDDYQENEKSISFNINDEDFTSHSDSREKRNGTLSSRKREIIRKQLIPLFTLENKKGETCLSTSISMGRDQVTRFFIEWIEESQHYYSYVSSVSSTVPPEEAEGNVQTMWSLGSKFIGKMKELERVITGSPLIRMFMSERGTREKEELVLDQRNDCNQFKSTGASSSELRSSTENTQRNLVARQHASIEAIEPWIGEMLYNPLKELCLDPPRWDPRRKNGISCLRLAESLAARFPMQYIIIRDGCELAEGLDDGFRRILKTIEGFL